MQRSARRWLAVGFLAIGCGPSAPPPSQAPPAAPSAAAAAPPATASAQAAASGGWRPHEIAPPASRRKKTGAGLDACVEKMRAAEDRLDDAGGNLYSNAFADEQSGRMDTARRGYFQLISQVPQSTLIPLAYLAFGELFAAEAASDPSKWELAYQAYKKVAEYPVSTNEAHAYALMRAAETQRSADPTRVLDLGTRSVQASREASQSCGPQIREQAFTWMIEVFVKSGNASQAAPYFGRLTGNSGELASVIDRLAIAYEAAGSRPQACRAVSALTGPERQALVERHCP